MNIRFLLAPALLSCCAMTACSVTGKLYPVQGPLVSQTPPPVYTANLSAPPSLTLTATLGNGESFKGKVKILAAPAVNPAAVEAAATTPPRANLSSAWDAVYGQGFYVARILGNQLGQTVLKGNQGTVIQVEIWSARGVAVDNNGNIYKVVFPSVSSDHDGAVPSDQRP